MNIKSIIFFSIFLSFLMFTPYRNIHALQGIAYIWNQELIEILILTATSILAVFLFVISFIAYKKDQRKKLLFVTAAFLLFAVKGVLLVLGEFFELLYLVESAIELIAQILDFGILALFFLGLIKK